MQWLKKLLGKKEDDASDSQPAVTADAGARQEPALQAAPVASADYKAEVQAMLEATAVARDHFYASLGTVDTDVLASLVNPTFRGGPRWPALRQAWSVIRKPGSVIVASNGLSDPFDEGDEPPEPLGFRLEVCAEAAGNFSDVARTWLFDLVFQISQNAADHGGFADLLERYGAMTMFLKVEGVPDEWSAGEDGVAILIGQAKPMGFTTPYGEVRVAMVTLLRPEELAFIEKDGDIAGNRVKLAALFGANPNGHVNALDRPAVAAG